MVLESMPQRTRRTCLTCGKPASEVGLISWRGNCEACGVIRFEENARGISEKRGPAHRRRLLGYAKYVERAMLDAGQARP